MCSSIFPFTCYACLQCILLYDTGIPRGEFIFLDSENKTYEQPTESRQLDMNPDDYAKLYVISDYSNGYHRAYELALLPNAIQLSENVSALLRRM